MGDEGKGRLDRIDSGPFELEIAKRQVLFGNDLLPWLLVVETALFEFSPLAFWCWCKVHSRRIGYGSGNDLPYADGAGLGRIKVP